MYYDGWLKLHRKILSSDIYKNVNVRLVYFHLLLVANIKDEVYNGVTIPRGSTAITFRRLADEVGISLQQTRTALKRLCDTDNIECISCSNGKYAFTIINLKRFEIWQLEKYSENAEHKSKKAQQTDIARLWDSLCAYPAVAGYSTWLKMSKPFKIENDLLYIIAPFEMAKFQIKNHIDEITEVAKMVFKNDFLELNIALENETNVLCDNEPVYKPSSVLDNHLSGTTVTGNLMRFYGTKRATH